MFEDDAAGRAARFAAISSRLPGRDKLVRCFASARQCEVCACHCCIAGVLAEVEAHARGAQSCIRCVAETIKQNLSTSSIIDTESTWLQLRINWARSSHLFNPNRGLIGLVTGLIIPFGTRGAGANGDLLSGLFALRVAANNWSPFPNDEVVNTMLKSLESAPEHLCN